MRSNRLMFVGAGLVLAVVFGVASFGAFAQSNADDPAPLTQGLNSPRHLTLDADGNLYIAESGTGGDFDAQGPFGPAKAGGSASIRYVPVDGSETDFLLGLPSIDALNGEVLGASKAIVTDDSIWLLLAQGSLDNPFTYSLLELSLDNKRILQHIDLYRYEAENNPDGEEIDSNPVDFVLGSDGVIYIADAGANTVYTWREEDGLSIFVTWDTNPVPSSVELGDDGTVYVGFLTGFPFPTGGATVEEYDEDGELVETYEGFTGVVDLLHTDGTLYAVEIGQFGEQGWTPNSGRVVDVFSDDTYIEGLSFPYGLAVTRSGHLFLSTGAAFSTPGEGQVLSLDGVGLDGNALPPAPVTTPDVTEEPTDEVTEEPTATTAPTDGATDEPTDEVTEEPTDEVTEEPTDEVTEEPTVDMTEEPTDEITEEPTVEVTVTEAPAETTEVTVEVTP